MSVIPYVIEQTSRGERSYDLFSRLLADRIVFLGEEVTDAAARAIVAQLRKAAKTTTCRTAWSSAPPPSWIPSLTARSA